MAKAGIDITEKAFTQQIRDLARMFGWRFYHPYLSIHSEKGFPDCTLVRERVVFAELKRESGKLTPYQEEWLSALKDGGAEVYVWRPSQFHEIAEILRR